MASGDVFGVKLHMTFAGQQCRPGFYLIEGGGGAGLTPCAAVVNAVVAALGDDPLAGFSAACSLDAIEANDIQPGLTSSFISNLSPAKVGDQADDNPVPPQDSMLIRWQTAKKPHTGVFAARGRTYVPGIYSTGQSSGFLASELQDALSAFASLLFDPFVSDGTAYQMHCVAFNPGTPRTVKAIGLVTAFTIDNQVDIVRRRRPGRGI